MKTYLKLQNKLTKLKNEIVTEIIKIVTKKGGQINVNFWLNENDNIINIYVENQKLYLDIVYEGETSYTLEVNDELSIDELFSVLFDLSND